MFLFLQLIDQVLRCLYRRLGFPAHHARKDLRHSRRVAYTVDRGPSEAVVKLAKRPGVLVSEVLDLDGVVEIMKKTAFAGATDAELKPTIDHQCDEHLSPAEVGCLAAWAGAKMVVLNHVGPGSDNGADMRQDTQGVCNVFDEAVVITRDGSEF